MLVNAAFRIVETNRNTLGIALDHMDQSTKESIRKEIADLVERINDIEVKLEYLQRDYGTQNEMILVDAKRIQILEDTVKRLSESVEVFSTRAQLPGNPEDDKPPHY